jgi:hypothetical protein
MPETGDGATPTVDTGTGYMPEIGDGQIDPGRGGVEVGGSGYYPETTGGVEVGGDGYYPDSPGGVEVGGEGAIPTTDACSFAAPMPEYWSLTCDPMTNVGCDDCANTGGTFLLAHSSGCEWIQVDTFDLCGVACRFRLAREGSNFVVRLEIVSTLFTRILFLLDEDDFDPMGVNVLPFSSINAFSCTDAPASVEITPSPGP